MNLNVKID